MHAFSLRTCLVLAAFAVVSCGGDDGSGSSGSSAGGAAGGGGTVEPAEMVQLPAGFWIDTTEVTRAQYEAWLQTEPDVAAQNSECSWNDDFTPGCSWPPGEEPNHPVVCVDWCDAYAYCKGVGKRLCGKIGGGTNHPDDWYDATKSQWYYACSSGGVYEYPYGNEYDADACNNEDSGLDHIAEVRSFEDCQSSEPGFEGVFDMTGNVREWTDACNGTSGAEDACERRAGSYGSSAGAARCRLASLNNREESAEGLGFRCCRD